NVLITSGASIIVLVASLLITGGTIVGGALAAAMLVGVIVIGATGILAMNCFAGARKQSARGGLISGFPRRDPVLPERCDLRSRASHHGRGPSLITIRKRTR